MELNLQSWYVVDSLESDCAVLRIRMVPDYFNSELADPVLEVSIQSPIDGLTAQECLARLKDHSVVDVQLSPTAMKLWGEFDDVPTIVSGAAVSYARSPYSNDDLLKIVLSLETQIGQLQTETAKLRAAAREIEGYARELLRRAEAKRSLTTRSTAIEDAQIDVLQRILNKIGAA